MAITAHYSAIDENGHLKLYSRLIAFRSVPSSHTGVKLGQVFFKILEETGLLQTVSLISHLPMMTQADTDILGWHDHAG